MPYPLSDCFESFSRFFVRLFGLASPLDTEAADADPAAVSADGRI